jgi:hypothetical protein
MSSLHVLQLRAQPAGQHAASTSSTRSIHRTTSVGLAPRVAAAQAKDTTIANGKARLSRRVVE